MIILHSSLDESRLRLVFPGCVSSVIHVVHMCHMADLVTQLHLLYVHHLQAGHLGQCQHSSAHSQDRFVVETPASISWKIYSSIQSHDFLLFTINF